jgi:twinkle protein
LGQHKIACPFCQDTRSKHKRDKPLSVNIESEKIIFNCHHCGENGIVPKKSQTRLRAVKPTPKPITKIDEPVNDLRSVGALFLKSRKISPEVALSYGTAIGGSGPNKYKPVIGFVYRTAEGDIEAIKYRDAEDKRFWWDGNATRLWGTNVKDRKLPDLENTIVITEGELDALAIKTAFHDYMNVEVYSVPNGAPSKITNNKVDASEDGRFKYVWEDRQKFEGVEKIILATDNDVSGDVLADELSRRLNKARCYRVDFQGEKDANDLLIAKGKYDLKQSILNAEPIPLHGLNSIDHYSEDFQSLYEKGMPTGVSTGFASVDKLFTLSTGNLFVVTGYPGDGKSAFIDQLIVNVASNNGWKTCFCSFEKPPHLHAVQIAQILTGKPFFKGARILVIDPFNFIQTDTKYALETDMVSDMLTKVQLFAKQHDVLVFFVSHPTKPQIRDGKKNVCTGVDIAKSMAWFSKADTGITVYRGDDGVQIHNWKARWGWQGSLGNVTMQFNPVNGRYREIAKVEDDFDWEI